MYKEADERVRPAKCTSVALQFDNMIYDEVLAIQWNETKGGVGIRVDFYRVVVKRGKGAKISTWDRFSMGWREVYTLRAAHMKTPYTGVMSFEEIEQDVDELLRVASTVVTNGFTAKFSEVQRAGRTDDCDEAKHKGLTVSVDFDGVLHSYSSGWKGFDMIPDPPVPGAIEWLVEAVGDGRLDVCIFSGRSSSMAGIQAMKKWLLEHGLPEDVLSKIRFPMNKPPAYLFIDDRALLFNGTFPPIDYICAFKPWYQCDGEEPRSPWQGAEDEEG